MPSIASDRRRRRRTTTTTCKLIDGDARGENQAESSTSVMTHNDNKIGRTFMTF